MPAINDSAANARARLDAALGDAPFSLLRPLDDETAWRDAFARTGCDPADAIAEGDRALQTADWSPIPDDLYLEFSRNGNRVNYQKALAEKTAPLDALLLAECAERQGRFVPAIVAGLECLYLQAKSWTLPAHDPGTTTFLGTFEYDSPQDFETAIIVYGEAARTAEDAIEIRRWTGDRAIVRVETSAPWAFSCETLDAEPNSPRYPRPTRIAIRFAAPASSGFVRVTFSSRSGDGAARG